MPEPTTGPLSESPVMLVSRVLFRLCDLTHFITLHRPWISVLPHCPFAKLAFRLEERHRG